MKVCILTDAWHPVWGGGQQHILEVISRLKERGLDIDIVAPNLTEIQNSKFKIQNYDSKFKIINKRKSLTLGKNSLDLVKGPDSCQLGILKLGPSFNLDDFLGRIAFTFRLLPFLLTSDYDVYHSHSYSTSIFLPLVKYLRHKKIYFTLHGIGREVVGLKKNSFFQKIFRSIGDILIYRYPYDCLFLIGLPRGNHEFNSGKVIELFNGVDVQAFDKIKVDKEKIFTILFVGRFDSVKNLPLLIKTAKILFDKGHKFRLKLVGGGYEEEKLKEMVKESGLEKVVKFTGWLFDEDLIKVYKSSHLFVLPSLSEGFPLTILEAWAAKLAVIASDIDTNDKLVNNNVNGYLFRSGEAENLSETIKKSILGVNLSELGNNGYEMVKRKYQWGKVADLTQNYYES